MADNLRKGQSRAGIFAHRQNQMGNYGSHSGQQQCQFGASLAFFRNCKYKGNDNNYRQGML